MDRINRAVELRDQLLPLLDELVKVGVLSSEASTAISEDISQGILTSLNKILTGGLTTGDPKKGLDASTAIKQPSAVPAIKSAAPAVFDSSSTSKAVERTPTQAALKAPEKSAQAGGSAREKVQEMTSGEWSGEQIRNYRKQFRQLGLATSGTRSNETVSSVKNDGWAAKVSPPEKEQQLVVYKNEGADNLDYTEYGNPIFKDSPAALPKSEQKWKADDSDDLDYDKYGSPIFKNSTTAYRVTVDEKHPDAMICPYWLEAEASTNDEHMCAHRGDHEPFFHKMLDGKPKQPLECSFWREGHCYRGNDCGFAHYRTRHGKIKTMMATNDHKLPFTVAADVHGETQRGLAASRYAAGNQAPTPQKRDNNTPGREPAHPAIDAALEDGTAKFRAFLGRSASKTPATAAKETPKRVVQPWEKSGMPGFNQRTYW